MMAKKGEWIETNIYTSWKTGKWSCDICRMSMSWYETVYGCQCDNTTEFGDNHAICLTCIHSIVKQYNELRPFMMELLENELNSNCIEEIVAFCIGEVVKFENSLLEQNQVNVIKIDDTKNVGSKRKLRLETDIGHKRRRLE